MGPGQLAVYAGPGAVGAIAALNDQLGGVVRYAYDFLDDTSWQTITNPKWTLDRWKTSGFRLILGVPMLPAQGASLTIGSQGSYDSEFVSLAAHLIASGDQSSVLSLGWDPLSSASSWAVTTGAEAAAYVSYWRQIVTSMESVAGAKFSFEWSVGYPTGSVSPSNLYPGNAYVHFIGTEIFDQGVGTTSGFDWYDSVDATYGPDWFADFASARHKSLVISQWGMVPSLIAGGGGDDPGFVQTLARWCEAHHIVFSVVWDYGLWAINDGGFPNSKAALIAAWGQS